MALYAGATTARYVHGVLGDDAEGASMVVLRVEGCEGASGPSAITEEQRTTLAGTAVFEGLGPFWAEVVGGSSGEELVATVSDSGEGAEVRVYGGAGMSVLGGSGSIGSLSLTPQLSLPLSLSLFPSLSLSSLSQSLSVARVFVVVREKVARSDWLVWSGQAFRAVAPPAAPRALRKERACRGVRAGRGGRGACGGCAHASPGELQALPVSECVLSLPGCLSKSVCDVRDACLPETQVSTASSSMAVCVCARARTSAMMMIDARPGRCTALTQRTADGSRAKRSSS
eukprot:1593827-Rhodomonas_salina.4